MRARKCLSNGCKLDGTHPITLKDGTILGHYCLNHAKLFDGWLNLEEAYGTRRGKPNRQSFGIHASYAEREKCLAMVDFWRR